MTAELISLEHHNRDQDALAIGALYRLARSSAVDSVHHLIEAGQRLAWKKAGLRRGQWLPWLEANYDMLGFDSRRTASRLIKAAAIKGDVNVPLDEADAVQINRMIWGNTTLRGTTGTGDNEWFTPSPYIDAARQALGTIDLDPASHDLAQATVNAERHYTRETDGLGQEWHGTVWLNPPYARDEIGPFIDKLIAELDSGRTTAAILLTHNYTDTTWFHTAARRADALCFTLSRVRFIDTSGEPAKPTQGQVFLYYGPAIGEFMRHFAPFGIGFVPYASSAPPSGP